MAMGVIICVMIRVAIRALIGVEACGEGRGGHDQAGVEAQRSGFCAAGLQRRPGGGRSATDEGRHQPADLIIFCERRS